MKKFSNYTDIKEGKYKPEQFIEYDHEN